MGKLHSLGLVRHAGELLVRQLLGGAAHDTLDTAARQIGQTVRIQERETVFEWMLVAETGCEGCN